MLSATLLTALVLAPGQLFKDIPVFESSAMRLHVGKQGSWTTTIEMKARSRSGDDAKTKEFFDEMSEGLIEEFSGGLTSVEFQSEVKVVGQNPTTIMMTVTGKGDDTIELLLWLRGHLGMERSTFSWDGKTLQLKGFPPKPPETSAGALLLGAVVSAVLSNGFAPDYSGELVLTTDGRFVVDHLPFAVEDDGRRLVLDVSKFDESPEQECSLRIEGLGE